MVASAALRALLRSAFLPLLLLSLSVPHAWAQNRYGQAVVTATTTGLPASAAASSNTPSFRSNPECAQNLVQTNPTLFVLGGYNVTGGSATIPYPSYAQADLWLSTNGFTSATWRPPVVVNNLTTVEVGRLSGAAGYLANGNLIWTGGLLGEYTGYIYYSASTYCSADMGVTWTRTLTSNATYTPPTTRYEMSYAVLPYTNTMVIGGGYMPFVAGEGGADVWMSSDGFGAVWTQRNAGGSVPNNYGAAMTALYDSSAVSSTFTQQYSTLVWVMTVGSYYLSTDGGVTWGSAYAAPWASSFLPYPTFTRELPVLTADHDNYLYFGGGDIGGPASDFWLSIDKAQTWTQLQIQSSSFFGGSQVFAAAWGSCLAVRVLSSGAKELDLYGGSIWVYGRNAAGTLVYNATQVYSMQMALSFASTPYAPQASAVSVPQDLPMRWYFNYQIVSTSPAYTICASGYVVTPTNPTIPTYTSTLAATAASASYLVWWIQGSRVFSNATHTISQVIAGLGPVGDDGASQYIYPNAAVQVDGGGFTYLLSGVGLEDTYNYVNVYSTGTTVSEGVGGNYTLTRNTTSPIRFSRSPLAPLQGCSVYVQASLSSGLQGAAPSTTSYTSTPQFRSNPECAYDLTTTSTLNPTYIALGGYNTTGLGADIPYPSYAQDDLWISTDGFSTTANTRYQAAVYNSTSPITKLSGYAGLLSNGILIYSGGLAGEYNGFVYFSTTTWASADKGATWNVSLNAVNNTFPYASTMRFDAAYCVVPYTNTLIIAGGISYAAYPNAAADVWMTTDGLGRNWTQQNSGTGQGSTIVHSGGVMVAMYDSTLVSAQFVTPNSTLVLIADSAAYAKSYNLGRTWTAMYTAPWAPSNVPYATYTRSLPVLTVDRDNYLYYGGGDSGTPQADWWFSWDKAESWTPIALVNGLSGYQFAAAIGSCLGVRPLAASPTAKELDLYGGNIYTRQVNATTNAVTYATTPYYSMQMQLQFSTQPYSAPLTAVPGPAPLTWYWAYQVQSSSGFSVCASGTVITPNTPTVETISASAANQAYLVWYLSGTRVFTNSTYAYSEVIGGLAPIWADGASNLIYPNQAVPLDGGGLSYQLASVEPGNGNPYINIYNNGSAAIEDGFQGNVLALSRPLVFSRYPLSGANAVCNSIIRGQATLASGLAGVPSAFSGQTNTPMYRSDPECAYDLNSTNPTMWAMGGYNQTSGTWSLAYPSYGKGDTWYSTDGFSTVANTVYVPGAQTYPRIAGMAAYLSNGVLLTWGGIIGEYSGYIYFAVSVGVSYDKGNTYNYSIYNDPAAGTTPSISRYEAAYCAIPYTSTVVHVGGVNYATYPNPSSDVWISSDGLGAVWNQQNAGGASTTVQPFQGGVMAAYYDSSLVSPQYISPNSTLLLVAPTGQYYKSYDLGRTFTFRYNAPWFRGLSSYVTIVRYLPVLTIDRDNYAYYGGGDMQTVAPDFWLSVDKAESWTRLQMVNQIAGGQLYAAAVGSCMAIRMVGGQKQLALYGGNIYTRSYNATSNSYAYSNTALYSIQMNLQFNSTAFPQSNYGLPTPQPITYYWSYQLRQSNASMNQFSVCAYGQMVASSAPTIASSVAYPVWSMTGARIFTNSTYSFSQPIGGLAYLNTDGSTNLLYPSRAIPVDGGGITYVLGATGLGEANTFVNLYSTGTFTVEDGWLQYEVQTVTSNLTVSRVPFNQYNPPCRINAAATVVSSLTGAASTFSGQTSTPQFRSNPECAYDLVSSNPAMYAIGGYNVTGGSAAIPYPVYARPDIWVSTDGFSSTTNSRWVPGQTGYPRLAACAAVLSSGALLNWCGIIGEYSNSIIFEPSVTISLDQGLSWNTTYNDPNPSTMPSVTRMEAAYCAIPYTNTVVHVGGVSYITYPNPSSDVWISSDGRGAVWNRQNTGSLPAFRGGALVALYDSSAVSALYLTPNATLVLALQQPLYAVSTDLGATWTQYQAPWAAAITSSPVFYRSLPSLTADHDNYLYYAGGDTQMWAPDMWLSIDKGYSWSRIALTTQLSTTQYAGAIGSCLALRVVNGQKQLTLYGGNILSYSQTTGTFASTPIYAIQLNLNFINRTSYNLTTSTYPVPVATSGNIQTLYWQYQYKETAAGGFSVCASGTAQVSTQTTYSSTGTSTPAYLITWMQGARITTNVSTGVVTSQIITGLAPIGLDGASNLYYPTTNPPIDGGGVTYYLASTGLGETLNYVNLYYNTAGVFAEDATLGGYSTINISSPLLFSTSKGNLSCPVYATATIASGLAGAPITFAGQTNTPMYRSNPECAYDLTTFNSSSPKMFSIGGYNITGGGAVIPYPVYAKPDIWVSTDGFTSAANTQWVPGQIGYPRLAACAAYTASGALISWCGLIGEYSGYVYFETSVTVSLDNGASWNTTYTDPSAGTNPSVTRIEAAYCALPYTNTIIHAGGINYKTYPSPSSDVWMSSDGQGAVWQQMNAGGSATNVPPFSGGQMVAMYDSSVISAQFPSPNATLVLVLDTAQYFKSTNLGWSWSTAYAAPWDTSVTPYPTYTRSLPVLAADQDNYLYFAGGDAGGPAYDLWVSVDKAETWTRMATLNSFSSSQAYAASVGSCMAVRVVNGQKQLALFGGNIWTYSQSSSAYSSTSYYSLQINVAFTPTAPATVASVVPSTSGQLWYWMYQLSSSNNFSICATGRLVTSSSPTLSTLTSSNPAYLVWWMSGNRVYTSATTTSSQAIAGLAPLDVDGASQYFYPSQSPPVDGGGLTYLLAGQGLGESNSFVNLYNNNGLNEDSLQGTVTVTMPFTFSKSPLGQGCPFYASGTISGGLTLSGGSGTGSATPATARYNPECAFDPTSTSPTMFALGGSADGGVTTVADLWYSTDGFSTAANTVYVNSSAAGRMNGGAAYLANGNLVWWGGLVNDITAATYLSNVYVSNTQGRTWNTSSLGSATLRQSFAYCAVPYTNTIVMAGGILYSSGSFSNDVWISSDGAGAVWTQQTNGSGTTVAPHVGAAMVALFDSSLVSSAYPAQYSTLVLVDHNLVYQSYNLGVTWTNASTAQWPLSYGGTRRFPVLAADRDNFLYFAGGDSVSPDVWFSADKGYTWTQLGTASYALATGNYAAALCACSAVRVVNGQKYLTIYGGDIYSYANGAYTQNYYALQLPVSYQAGPPSYATSPVPAATSQPAYWKYTLGGAGYVVCASGTFTLGSAPLLGVLPVAYTVYAITGSRSFTNGSSTQVQTITGLAPIGSDGASNKLYLSRPGADGGGITFYVNGQLAILGGSSSLAYVNLYNNSGSVSEDGWATPPTQSGSGLVWSFTNDGSFTCAGSPTAVSSAAPRASSTAAAAPSSGGAVAPTTTGTASPPIVGGGGSSSSGLSGGAIAGIVVGSVVAAVLCLLFLIFCIFTQRKGKSEMSTTTGARDSELSTVRPSQMEMAPVGESEHSRVDAAQVGEGHGEEMETA